MAATSAVYGDGWETPFFIVGDAARYWGIGGRNVIAVRFRAGGLLGPSLGQALPEAVRRLHPRFRTPHVALGLFGVVACLTLLPGQADFLGTVYAFGAMLSFSVAHLALIRLRFTEPDRERPFRGAHFVPLNAPDPDAPPQWNLANAPEDRVWSLMIGAYKDTPDRKRLAVGCTVERYADGIPHRRGGTVRVRQLVVDAHGLPGELRARAPHLGVPELLPELPVQHVDTRVDDRESRTARAPPQQFSP